MKNPLHKKDLISISDLSVEEIRVILKRAEHIKKGKVISNGKNNILASCFYEPSTRTRFSFESAMMRIGGNVIGFSEPSITSSSKGESLTDTMKVLSRYVDVIVLRHPKEGAARVVSEVADVPIINAGDGANQHPTQTLLDLFTIKECQRKLQGVRIAFVGDLKYGRTVHSLAMAACHFDMRMYFVSPDALTLPKEISDELRRNAIRYSFHRSISEILEKVDVLYMTRLQKERFEGSKEIDTSFYHLTKEHLKKAKKNLRILHPLPRLHEVDPEIDHTPYAYYFQQAENGLYIRMALLSLILGGKNV